MDYRATLNLPRTDFPMKADLVTREPQRLAQWESGGLYQRVQAARVGRRKMVLHDGPPFANGDVHIGTAGNKILKDIVVKYHTLRGRYSPYVPGWDCHGLPIEFKVSQELRKAGNTAADPATIRAACEAYAHKFIDLQRQQFKRLGILGDWENPYLTLHKEYEAEELRLFADLVERGFVYRGKKPVYWSIPCRTALAEAEVEYQDHTSQSVYVKFPIVGEAGLSVVIWTTTPWTLPANLAVAYNSTFSYSLVRVGTERFIVSSILLPAVAEKCRWVPYEIIQNLTGDQLRRLEYHHPFCHRTGKFFAGDNFVENTTGTGFVHIAPGHGLEDYQLGSKEGLPIYSPVNDDGCFAHTNDLPVEQQMPAAMVGKPILAKHGHSEANTAVLDELRARHALVHQESYLHSYPHCWRSKTPVIFRAMDQWFIEIDHLEPNLPPGEAGRTFRERALAAIETVRWVPDTGKNRIQAAVKLRPDWCISRQRSWGVPIPAFYDAAGNPILEPPIVRKAADLIELHGSNVWYARSTAELWAALKPANWTGPEAAAKVTDTLDVWIDSGSSSRAVLMRRPELRSSDPRTAPAGRDWQAEIYLEGSDQHRGWFQSSLLLSLAGNGAPPYQTVLTAGFMVDADREKISKSKQGQGGYDKPQIVDVYIKKWGADILRLWITSQDFRSDVVVSDDRISQVAETYRVLRNALRFQLSNLYDFDPSRHAVPDSQLTGLDCWMLDAFGQLETEVMRAYEAYEFQAVYQRISQFAAVELSAIYHDLIKDRLYTDAADAPRRRSTQTVLYRLVTGLCELLEPILVFTTDEAWTFIPQPVVPSVHLAEWKPHGLTLEPAERARWQQLFAVRDQALAALEQARQNKLIGKALEAQIILSGSTESLGVAQAEAEALRELLNVSQLHFSVTPGAPAGGVQVRVSKAAGRKCERCWHWETDIGTAPDHPGLCGRCVQALGSGRPA